MTSTALRCSAASVGPEAGAPEGGSLGSGAASREPIQPRAIKDRAASRQPGTFSVSVSAVEPSWATRNSSSMRCFGARFGSPRWCASRPSTVALHRSSVLEELQDGLEALAREVRGTGRLQDDTYQTLAPEGHADAHPRLQAAPAFRWP